MTQGADVNLYERGARTQISWSVEFSFRKNHQVPSKRNELLCNFKRSKVVQTFVSVFS